MKHVDIRGAVAVSFAGSGLLPTTAIAWENTNSDPSAELWARFNYMPDISGPFTTGPLGRDKLNGLVQISVNASEQLGVGSANALADQILLHFYNGRHLQQNGQEVRIVRGWLTSGELVQGFWQVLVTIEWYALATRPA